MRIARPRAVDCAVKRRCCLHQRGPDKAQHVYSEGQYRPGEKTLDLVQHVYAAVPAAVWLFTLLSRTLGSC